MNFNIAGDDRRGVKRRMELSSCEVCEAEEAKYRCPGCMKHSCSLPCVQQHKLSFGCSGVRDKTMFVSLSEFNEINLLSDYRFLEDTARLREQSHRDPVVLAAQKFRREGSMITRKARAVKVTLKLLPKTFTKHKENTTIFKKADQRIHWHLKIHFPHSRAIFSERFSDDKLLEEILNGFIHPSDPVKQQRLQLYVSRPDQIRVFLKAELKLPNAPRYYELDLKKSLQENLMHRTILEFPEVFVVLEEQSQEYRAPTARAKNTDASRAVPSNIDGAFSPMKAFPNAPVNTEKKRKHQEEEELEEGELCSEDEEDEESLMRQAGESRAGMIQSLMNQPAMIRSAKSEKKHLEGGEEQNEIKESEIIQTIMNQPLRNKPVKNHGENDKEQTEKVNKDCTQGAGVRRQVLMRGIFLARRPKLNKLFPKYFPTSAQQKHVRIPQLDFLHLDLEKSIIPAEGGPGGGNRHMSWRSAASEG
ncbi:hypothetical protein DNTS_012112 [Danionella cerebrum]|uniref:Box C/D snoRNA protein 1 n=1 Tax=Danionella cerebrum TaxID=2873325 RepID=A0A553PUC9_9TELE|nr:hypothetical protein DNTS_012112 [Danionella translucida]